MDGVERIAGWDGGIPSPRLHHINALAEPAYWAIRKEKIEDFFDEMLGSDNALFTMPVVGDFIMATYGGDSWLYRISRNPDPAHGGRKYDEDGVEGAEDVSSIDFELVRGDTFKFIARLINYREAFWAKITVRTPGSSVYTLREVWSDSGTWEEVDGAVDVVAVEQGNIAGLPLDLIVRVTKVLSENQWQHVFHTHQEISSERNELSDDDYAEEDGWTMRDQTINGVRFPVTRFYITEDGPKAFTREIEIDATGHVHKVGEESELDEEGLGTGTGGAAYNIDALAPRANWATRQTITETFFGATAPSPGDFILASDAFGNWRYLITDVAPVTNEVGAFTFSVGGDTFYARLIEYPPSITGTATSGTAPDWILTTHGGDISARELSGREVKIGEEFIAHIVFEADGAWEWVFEDWLSCYSPIEIEICTDSGPKDYEFLAKEVP